MVKKSPSLQLVEKRPLPEGRAGFEVASFSDLSAGEQKRVERIMQQLNPEAGIVGVAKLPHSWDLRPIVVVASDSEPSPSIIRFLGPEVTLSLNLTSRVGGVLKRLLSLGDTSARLLQWGQLEGQIWYRRSLVTSMLSDRLVEPEPIAFSDALSIAVKLVATVEEWHEQGIIHGHLASSNITLGPDGSVFVLDPAVGLALVQANTSLGVDEFPKGYSPVTFAPEAVQSEFVSYETDVFGLGRVFWELFGRVPRAEFSQNKMSGTDFRAIRELVLTMADEDPQVRPSLEDVRRTLDNRLNRAKPSAKSRLERQDFAGDSVSRPTEEFSPAELPPRTAALPPEPPRPEPPRPELPRMELPRSEPQAQRDEEREPYETPALELPYENFPHQEPFQEFPAEIRAEHQPRSLRHVFLPVAGVLLLLFGIVYYLQEPRELSDTELRLAWESGMPSRMQQVAVSAVRRPIANQTAQDLIVRSALGAEKPSSFVNAGLLRVAFDPRWEAELSSADRRVAVTLATVDLLKTRAPREEVNFEELHPGVVLALLASLPTPAAVNKIAGLGELPAAKLRGLPPPSSVAFEQLLRVTPDLRCGDAAVLALVRFATRGLQSVDEVARYLETDTALHLATLAALFSTDETSARQLVEWITTHPNFRSEHELIVWGKQVRLSKWANLSNNDKLFLLAGIPLKNVTAPELVVQMLGHPSLSVRRSAIEKTVDLVVMQHPGALAVLNLLKESPQHLTPLQTLQLALFLIRPESAKPKDVRDWLKTSPPQNLLEVLVLAAADYGVPTPFDLEVALYLYRANWEPTVEELGKLSHHPVRFARLFAYTKLFRLPDRETALRLLRAAEKKESDEELRRQLELNIGFLSLE